MGSSTTSNGLPEVYWKIATVTSGKELERSKFMLHNRVIETRDGVRRELPPSWLEVAYREIALTFGGTNMKDRSGELVLKEDASIPQVESFLRQDAAGHGAGNLESYRASLSQVGAGGPKRPVSEVFDELEEAVNDAIMSGQTDDRVLEILIDLTVTSEHQNRPLFPNVMDEPDFYRLYFKKWVLESLAEAAALNSLENKAADPDLIARGYASGPSLFFYSTRPRQGLDMNAILKAFIDQGLHLPPNVQDYAAGLVANAYQSAIESLPLDERPDDPRDSSTAAIPTSALERQSSTRPST